MNKLNYMSIKKYIKKELCRLCQSGKVSKILTLPKIPIVDAFRPRLHEGIDLEDYPADLYQCESCGHAQLLDVVNPKILFGDYIYTSSSSPDLDSHFSEYTNSLMDQFKLCENSTLIDIGCNDGLFLRKVKEISNAKIFGVDASLQALVEARKNQPEVNFIEGFLTQDLANEIVQKYSGPFDFVTANNVFSHMDEMHEFAISCKKLINKNGLFIFEVSYLLDTVRNFVVDYVYHEHLAHHSVKPLKSFLEKIELKLLMVQRIKPKGGSIRCVAANKNADWAVDDSVDMLIKEEEEAGLYSKIYFQNWEEQIKFKINDFQIRFKQITDNNPGKIIGYGACPTGSVLLRLLEVEDQLNLIVDDNPLRNNLLSPSSLIPVKVVTEVNLTDFEVIIILAWRFKEAIIKNIISNGFKGQVIVPYPNFEMINVK